MFQISRLPHLIFGVGSVNKLSEICNLFGKNILLITGKNSFDNNTTSLEILKKLEADNFQISRSIISNEPSSDNIDDIVTLNRELNPKVVVSIGGGSVIDAGKSVSAMLTVNDPVENYIEGIGKKSHPGTKIPFVAIPTTSGTGSEATKNAVISRLGDKGYKRSLRHDNFIPDFAIVDPQLTINCPPDITAFSGMDAFTQLVESYISIKSNLFTDNLAIEGIKRIIQSLEKAVHNGSDIDTRADLAYAAYLSGITLANAGLGVIHGFAQPLGSILPIPHGVVCGSLMGISNRITWEKIRDNSEYYPVKEKYMKLGGLVPSLVDEDKPSDIFISYIEELIDKLNIPKLSEYGLNTGHIQTIVAKTGLKNHPVHLSETDLKEIIQARI